MGSHLILAAFVTGIGLSSTSAPDNLVMMAAGDCSAAAQKVVAETKGQLLSARPAGNACVVTVLVPSEGGRPRKVTIRVPM